MQTFIQIISRWDGADKLAEDLGVPASHVRTMIARNSVSPEHWPRMVEGAKQRGIEGLTYEHLVHAYANRHAARASTSSGVAA